MYTTQIHEHSSHTYKWGTSHTCVRMRGWRIPYVTHVCTYVRRASVTCVTRVIHMCHSHVRDVATLTCVTLSLIRMRQVTHMNEERQICVYSRLYLECHLISISNLNLLGLLSTEQHSSVLVKQTWRTRSSIEIWDLRMKKWHSECNKLYICVTCAYKTSQMCVHMRDVPRLHVWHDSFTCVTCLSHKCDMTHSYVWHDLFLRVTWLIHTCDMTHPFAWTRRNKSRASFICSTNLIRTSITTHVSEWVTMNESCHTYEWVMCDKPNSHGCYEEYHDLFMCDMTDSHVWHATFARVTWLIHRWHDSFMCDMTHLCVWHDSSIFVTCLSHMCDVPNLYVRRTSFKWVTLLIHVWYDCITCVTCHTHSYEWHDSLHSYESHDFFH